MTFWMVLLALTMPPEISLVGRLMIADVVCIGIVGWAVLTRNLPPMHRVERTFYVLATVWLVTQIVTDIYVQSAPEDYLRGWARIVFFMINFTAVRIVLNRSLERAMFFLTLVLLAAALKFALGNGNVEKTGELATDWKFGYGAAFTVFCMYAGAQVQRLLRVAQMSTFGALAAAAVNLALNARSLFGQAAFAALIGPMAAARGRRRINTSTILLALALAGAGGFMTVETYSYAAEQGLLGQDAKDKYERQAENNLGLLLSGRTELLGSLDAVSDSPIIGYGSYARDSYYADLRFLRLQQAGIPTPRDIDSDRIPTHSFLFGAWVEAGILGALFWFWVLFATVRAVRQSLEQPGIYTSLIIFAAIALAWDVAFSPFGLDRRIVTPALLNIMLLITMAAQAKTGEAVAEPAPTRTPATVLRRRHHPLR